jgi:hypothetical protein
MEPWWYRSYLNLIIAICFMKNGVHIYKLFRCNDDSTWPNDDCDDCDDDCDDGDDDDDGVCDVRMTDS